jgi:hypothetical protein
MGWWMGSNFGSNFDMGFGHGFFSSKMQFFAHFENLGKYGLDYGLVYGCLPRKTHVFAKFSQFFPIFSDFGEIWVGLWVGLWVSLWVPLRKNACFGQIFPKFLILKDFREI